MHQFNTLKSWCLGDSEVKMFSNQHSVKMSLTCLPERWGKIEGNWRGREKQTNKNLPLAYVIYRENHYHYHHPDKKTLGWAPKIISLNNKGFCFLSSDIFCAHPSCFYYFLTRTNMLTKILPTLAPPSGTDHRSWTMEWHTTLSSNQTKKINRRSKLQGRESRDLLASAAFEVPLFYSILMWCCS